MLDRFFLGPPEVTGRTSPETIFAVLDIFPLGRIGQVAFMLNRFVHVSVLPTYSCRLPHNRSQWPYLRQSPWRSPCWPPLPTPAGTAWSISSHQQERYQLSRASSSSLFKIRRQDSHDFSSAGSSGAVSASTRPHLPQYAFGIPPRLINRSACQLLILNHMMPIL